MEWNSQTRQALFEFVKDKKTYGGDSPSFITVHIPHKWDKKDFSVLDFSLYALGKEEESLSDVATEARRLSIHDENASGYMIRESIVFEVVWGKGTLLEIGRWKTHPDYNIRYRKFFYGH